MKNCCETTAVLKIQFWSTINKKIHWLDLVLKIKIIFYYLEKFHQILVLRGPAMQVRVNDEKNSWLIVVF